MNLGYWYLNNYRKYNDDLTRMINYLNKHTGVSREKIHKQLLKFKLERIKLEQQEMRMKQMLYRPESKWCKYLREQMFKGW